VVVAALGFLDVGEAGAGLLNAAWGVGCVAGGAVVLALLGRGRLTAGLTAGALVIGVALEGFAAAPWAVVAAVALVVYGGGYTLVEIAAETLLQRLTPDHVLARVAGVVETLSVAALAVGSLGAGVLAGAVGPRPALAAAGVVMPAVVLLRRGRLARLEAGAPVAEREYRLLREHRIFAPLPVAQAEYLARTLTEVRVDAGETVMAEGQPGDRFYLIAEGRLEAEQGGEHLRTMTGGDGFGEIALLRDVPRTASVTALTPAVLLALERDTFLEAVTSQPYSGRAAGRIADERLAAAP
jgi:MFS family permease